MIKNIKEKFIGASGSVSGIASVLSSWQVCHNLCLGIIALLSIIGITLVGMPLEFLTKIAIPLWTIAFSLLLITLLLYIKKKCISNKLILLNSGLIIMGIPFQELKQFSIIFWIVGGSLIISSLYLFVKDRREKKRCCKDG